jgi:hypothetical protein
MWILILTIAFNTPTIVSIPGFATQAGCDAAAVRWMTETRALPMEARRIAVCVKNN